MFNSTTFKLALFNIFGFALVIAGFFYHFIQQLYVNDTSKLTYIISAFLVSSIILCLYDSVAKTHWIRPLVSSIRDDYLYVGLAGTLIGFITLIGAINGDGSSGSSSEQVAHLLVAIKTGSLTAFNPTLLGVVSYLWTKRLLLIGKDH